MVHVPEGEDKKPFKVDFSRFARLTTYGFCCAGPFYCWWYGWLDKFAAKKFIHHGVVAYVGGKILLDQFLMEPPNLVMFFTATGVLEGQTSTEIKQKMSDELAETFLVDCCVWPVAQLVNFTLVPVHFQALYTNSVSCLWSAFLSYMSHRRVDSHDIHASPVAVPAQIHEVK